MVLHHHPNDLQHLRQKLVVILGPTATGKTKASIEVALNLRQHGIAAEIVNADSMQVYQGFDIGTAKPTPLQMQQVKHHLFGLIEPTKDYNAASYVNACTDVIDILRSRGVLPIVVGGTNMYIEGLIWPSVIDMQRSGPDDVQETYEEYTTQELYDKLNELDRERAAMLHQNDRKRITRSLDVIRIYGMKHSDLIQQRKMERDKIGSKYDVIIFAMQCEPETHKKLIQKRTQAMLQNGIIEECLNLMKIIENDKTIDVKRGICQSIAYKELMPILEESMNKESLPSDETMKRCAAALETATWQYTRKQNTWIRNRIKSETGVKVVHIDTTDVTHWDTAIIGTMINEIVSWHTSSNQ